MIRLVHVRSIALVVGSYNSSCYFKVVFRWKIVYLCPCIIYFRFNERAN